MPPPRTLTVETLEALGAARLSALLIDIAAGDPAIKRRLRLALAGEAGTADVAREISKRLATLGKASSFVDWKRLKPLSVDLATQHRAIVDVVARSDPAQALDLLWRFMALVDPIMARCDDSQGRLANLFQAAAADLAPLALAARVDPTELARNVFGAVRANGYGQYDGLIGRMAEPLGSAGLASLEQRMLDWRGEALEPPVHGQRRVVAYGADGPFYADELEARFKDRTIRSALRDIADAQNDVDGFIAQYDADARRAPAIAVAIARRLLNAGRADEALRTIECADRSRIGWLSFDWRQIRIEALEALGKTEEAHAFRWTSFTETLESRHLRAYLKALPEFDDVEAEDRALALALEYPDPHAALDFLLTWPALDRANLLVLTRFEALDGNLYELLAPAGDRLEARYPLAATLVRRAMIDFTLSGARAKRYAHAARHLAECAADARRIDDFGPHATHEDYLRKLRADHARKSAFWQNVRLED